MNIIVDAFGGDNAPLEVIKGCRMAQENLGIDITLTGNKNIIAKTAADNGIDRFLKNGYKRHDNRAFGFSN